MNSAGARWLRDERLGRNEFGERDQPRTEGLDARKGGDPCETAPHTYPFTSHMDEKSLVEWFLICRDAELIH